jgi:hypothetical protein
MQRIVPLAVLLFGLTTAAPAATLAPSKPSQMVNLSNAAGPIKPTACSCSALGGFTVDIRINPDGTTTSGFTIPADEVLVLAGMTWFTAGTLSPGDASYMNLCVNGNAIWFDRTVSGANTYNGRSLDLPNLVIKGGQTLCAGGPAGFATNVSGFLTKDK